MPAPIWAYRDAKDRLLLAKVAATGVKLEGLKAWQAVWNSRFLSKRRRKGS